MVCAASANPPSCVNISGFNEGMPSKQHDGMSIVTHPCKLLRTWPRGVCYRLTSMDLAWMFVYLTEQYGEASCPPVHNCSSAWLLMVPRKAEQCEAWSQLHDCMVFMVQRKVGQSEAWSQPHT